MATQRSHGLIPGHLTTSHAPHKGTHSRIRHLVAS